MKPIPWTTAADLAARGLDLLTPMVMTPEQVADLVDCARANTEPFRVDPRSSLVDSKVRQRSARIVE